MPTYTNIATGQVLTQDEFSALVCNETYTCCNQADGVWFTANDAKNEYQWQQYFIANNLCSDGNAPINTVAPAISGTLVVGNVLTSSTGTWTSDTGIIPPYTYQWYRGLTLIVGATNNTYTLVQADAGQNIKCVVTACDSDGCTNANSNSVYIIDAEAQAHFNRVVADGGTIPLGLTALNEFVVSVKNNYSVASVNTAMWALKPHWGVSGIKTASGTGATAGGRATSVLYDICGVNGDFIQTTASAQPLALVHSGVNYLWSVAEAGNFINSTTTYATSDFDVEFSVNLQGTSNIQRVVSGGSASSPWSIVFRGTSNIIDIEYYVGGYRSATCSTSLSGLNTFRISRNSSTGAITILKNGVSQTVAGTQIAGALDSLPTQIRIGNIAASSEGFQGVINWVKLYISGSLVREMNPSSYNRATSQTSWVSATGETWTLNTASTNNALKAAIVDQTMIMGNGTSYGMRAPNLNINDTAITSYTVFRKFVNTVGNQIVNELGVASGIFSGKALRINNVANTERVDIFANVGQNSSSYTSTDLSLKVATVINNIANANESLPYLINNVSQSFSGQPANANNTTAMNATGYNFLARNNSASEWANVIAIGDIVVKGEDDTTKRTAMFNLLKTLSKI
jgi:hypothetical protein